MTRAELIAALQRTCGHCGHAWLQHQAASAGMPRVIGERVIVGDPAPFREARWDGTVTSGLCKQCACPARYGFAHGGELFVVVPVVFPCCGEKGALVTTEPTEIAGAAWRTKCARCGAGLAVSQVVKVAVLQ